VCGGWAQFPGRGRVGPMNTLLAGDWVCLWWGDGGAGASRYTGPMSLPASALAPPPILAGARVLEYAIVDETVVFTGRLQLYNDSERFGPLPRLAICQAFGSDELLLFYCNDSWETLGVETWNGPDDGQTGSIEDVKRSAENYYNGISSCWIALDVTEEEAKALYEKLEHEFACSFCGKGPDELRSVFRGPQANICGECVRKLHGMLDEPDAPPSLQ